MLSFKNYLLSESDLQEAHKLGDKVIITRGPKDVVGKVGHIGEIRKRYAGDTNTYTIDHEGGSIQLKPTHFKKHISESSEKHGVLAFGRMNPITSGHEAVINKVHQVAKEHNASHTVVVSHSQDAKKNPLSAEQKVKHAKRAFPDTNIKAASKESPTIMHHAAELHKQGVEHLHVVAGSDRKEEMHNLLHKYNTGEKHGHGSYKFKSITVHSSGQRDPDAEGTTGISASKMREHAASGNQKAFHAGAPSKMSEKHKAEMYHDVRKGMGHE